MRLWALVGLFSVAGMASLAVERSPAVSVALFSLGSLLALGAAVIDALVVRQEANAVAMLKAAQQRQDERLLSLEGRTEILEKRSALERM